MTKNDGSKYDVRVYHRGHIDHVGPTINKADTESAGVRVQELEASLARLAAEHQKLNRALEEFLAAAQRPQPDKDELRVTGEGIIGAATALTKLADPVVSAVQTVLRALGAA